MKATSTLTATEVKRKQARDAILSAPNRKPPPKKRGPKPTLLSELRTAANKADWDIFPDPSELHQPEATFDSVDPSLNPAFLPVPTDPYTDTEPWNRMGGEADRDFLYFTYYRSLGLTRTFTAVTKHFQCKLATVSKLSRNHNWPARVAAWDAYKEELYNFELMEATREMAGEHAAVAAKGIRAIAIVFDEIVERLDNDPELIRQTLRDYPLNTLLRFSQDAARVLPNLMAAERLSRGLPTDLTAAVIKQETTVTVRSSDELAEIVASLAGITTIEGTVISEDFSDDGDGEAEA